MKYILVFLLTLTLNACANAPFPELENDHPVIASDSKNAEYENIEKQPVKPVVVENTAKKAVAKTTATPKKQEVKKAEDKAPSKKVAQVQPKPMAEAKPEPKGPTIEVLRQTFYFNDGSSVLSGYNKELKDLVSFIKKNKAKVKVLGHASSRTHDTDPVSHRMANFEASFKRAQSVSQALQKRGIKKDDIVIEALSDSRPAYLEVMPEGERLNRRAEVYLIY